MEYLGFSFAVIIGLVMGLIGGGGSILSVPVFVYLFHYDAITATSYSLFVVGVTSAFGVLGHIKERKIRLRYSVAFLFGLPSILGVVFSRRIIVPNLPHYIVSRWGVVVTNETFVLLLFSMLMLVSSYQMIKNTPQRVGAAFRLNHTLLVSQGLLVGIVTGFVGAGGGFLIVPALVMLVKLNIREAIATSLFIIAINANIGFLSSLDGVLVDWGFLFTFSSLSILGIVIGLSLSKKIEGKRLKPIFGWFVLCMGVYVILKETIFQG
ncbi:MAG: sulfite exporter TauE/SafE family protein [Bergeyella sp.]|nr:sulfite exporter TauE/SafE family protein [Bergeyella sp.]